MIEYFNLVNKCDKTSQQLTNIRIPLRLERIHPLWQLTKYIVRNKCLFTENSTLVYYLESEDKKSQLLLPHNCVEEIELYHSI